MSRSSKHPAHKASNKSKAKNFRLELTEEQLEIISKACELYGRIQMGQLRVIAEHFFHIPNERLDFLRQLLTRAEPYASGLGGGYHSISSDSIPDSARVAMDIHQVVRHHLSWKKNPAGGSTVNFDKPMQFSDCPLAEITDRRDVLK